MSRTTTESWRGRAALMACHCAGMVDLVALPVWVGTLVSGYHLDPQQAGALATLFLAGAVASSLFFAPRLRRLRGRIAAPVGYGVAALAFFMVSTTHGFALMAAGHAVAGLAAGCGLSFTHGTIGSSANPHRLFALTGLALGVFAIAFLGATPPLVAQLGGPTLFKVFAGVMALAAVIAACAFPEVDPLARPTAQAAVRLDAPIWFAIVGVACMGLTQAMMFSFLERIGNDRGFGLGAVTGVLVALGFVNLLPAPLAALFQQRWPARRVVITGPLVQAALVIVMMQATSFAPYAVAASVFAAVMIFTHTFAFGLLARLDPTARALAATPAMLMVGAAIGPVLGGTLVKTAGYGSLGLAASIAALVAVFSFARARRALVPSGACA